MREYKYLIIVFLLLFGILFGPNFYIAGVSLRVFTTMTGIILLFFQRKFIVIDKVFLIYVLYILFYIFVSVLNGAANEEYFIKGLLNLHLPCILLYLLIPSYVDLEKNIISVCYLIIGLLLFDVLISLGQFCNFSMAWNVGNTINAHASEMSGIFMERHDVSMGYLGLSIINGICASVVDNGYFIATGFPLLFIMSKTNDEIFGYKIVMWLFVFLAVLASFLIQQRMGFYLIILFIVYHFWTTMNVIGRILLILSAIIIVFSAEFWLINVDFGRVADVGDEDRAETYLNSVSMIFEDARLFYFGGEEYYRQFFKHAPHNTIIGAWVYSGIFGFFIFMTMIILAIKKIVPAVIRYGNKFNIVQYSLAVCCLMFIMYSMTHSAGIHNGKGFYFWLFYGLFLKYQMVTCLKYSINENGKISALV